MELARLRIDRRTGTVRPRVGPGEQVLKTFHRSLHILEAGIVEKQMCQWISYYEMPSSSIVSKQKQDTENILRAYKNVVLCNKCTQPQTRRHLRKANKQILVEIGGNFFKHHWLRVKVRGLMFHILLL